MSPSPRRHRRNSSKSSARHRSTSATNSSLRTGGNDHGWCSRRLSRISAVNSSASAARPRRMKVRSPLSSAPRCPRPPSRMTTSISSPIAMSWEPELEELRRREELARRMGGEERVARQHASGRLTVRERVERLLDEGSFHETGALAGVGTYGEDGELEDFLPANCVVGTGRIDGRRTAVQGDDFTVRGGAADAAIWQKMVWAERLAHDLRIPPVRLVDGTGGGGSVKTLETMGFTYVPFVPGFELVVENLSRV